MAAAKTTRRGYTGVMYRDRVNTNVMGAHSPAEISRVLLRLDVLEMMKRSDVPALVDYALDFEAALNAMRLSPRESTVYLSRYVRQLSVGETALLHEMSQGSVNTYCRRIAAKVLERLNGIGGDLS